MLMEYDLSWKKKPENGGDRISADQWFLCYKMGDMQVLHQIYWRSRLYFHHRVHSYVFIHTNTVKTRNLNERYCTVEKKNIKIWTERLLTQQAAHPHMAGLLRNGREGAQEAVKSMGFAGSHRSDPTGGPSAPASAPLYPAASCMQDQA